MEWNIGQCTVDGEVRRDTGTQKHDNLSLITDFVFTYLGILNLTTADNLLTASFYVVFRSQHPDNTTVDAALEELPKNNIDVGQMVEYSRDHCP